MALSPDASPPGNVQQPPVASNVLFEEGLSKFSFDLYGQIGKDGNEFISPFSISAAMLLVMLGTDGTTKNQMRTAMFKTNIPTDIHHGYQILSEELSKRTQNGVMLSIANRLFPSTTFTILDTYKANASKYYKSDIQSLDFATKAELARTTINNWIAANTKDKIKDMIPPNTLDASTIMVLANAIYFKGAWQKPFEQNATRKMNFIVSANNQKQVDMMHGEFKALSGSDTQLACKVLRLPYAGNKLSMVFILPNAGNGLSELETKLSFTKFNSLLANLRRQEAIIDIPKFKIESEYDLKSILENVGMTEIFDPMTANFSQMVSPALNNRVYVSKAIHKTYLEVNEEGSEAAAATTVEITFASAQINPQPPFVFKAEHPFMFAILDNETKTILFIGRYSKP